MLSSDAWWRRRLLPISACALAALAASTISFSFGKGRQPPPSHGATIRESSTSVPSPRVAARAPGPTVGDHWAAALHAHSPRWNAPAAGGAPRSMSPFHRGLHLSRPARPKKTTHRPARVEEASAGVAPGLPAPGPTPPASSGPVAARTLPVEPGSIYWGAWIGNQLTGTEAPWDMGAVARFEQFTRKRVSLINFSSPFADCSSSPCRYYGFPRETMEKIRAHGAIPFFSWASQSTPASLDEPDFQLSDVIEGRYDSYIRSFAEGARAWGHPFFLRFNWEMNGNWFAWMEGVNGNASGESVAAWRHVHDIFREVGATNATWVWCPNVDPYGNLHDLASLYPGDAYVDWTGLDGYNWGTNPAHNDQWLSFEQLYRSTYEYIAGTLAPSKPLAIAEIGSTESGGSKAAWIRDALASIASGYPKVGAVLWFEKYDNGMDWPIETSNSATAAFAAGIGNEAFAENRVGSLNTSPIPAGG